MLAGMFAGRGSGGPPPAGSLYDELMSDGPVNYWRNGEASLPSPMIDEVAADGTYGGTVSVGNAALYAGGGTSITGFSNTALGSSTEFPPSPMAEICIVTVVRFNSLSGVQPVGVQRQTLAGNPKYQLSSTGSDFRWVRINGGVGVYTVSGAFTTGVTYLIGVEVDSTGATTIYINGVAQTGSWTSGAAAPGDFGGAGDSYQLGYFEGGAAALDGFTCDNAIFDYLPGATRQAAYAAAAGL